MDDSPMIMDFVGTLRESYKLFFKNRKLILSITSLTLFLYSILFLSNFFSIQPLLVQLIQQSVLLTTSPSSAEFANIIVSIKENLGIFSQVQCIFVLAFSIFTLFLATAAILASALTQSETNLSFKDLLSATIRSCKRVVMTLLYITLFGVGYIFLVLAFLLPMLLLNNHPVLSIFLTILSSLFYAYLAVVWTLALVVSVIEEKHGIEALGKAADLVKGMELQGFLLNLVFITSTLVLFLGFSFMARTHSSVIQLVIGLLVLNSICLVRICWLVAYTVFYFKCKANSGEEAELQGQIAKYSNLSTTVPLIGEGLYDERKSSMVYSHCP